MKILFFRMGEFKRKTALVLIVFCLFIFFICRIVHNYHERIISLELQSETFPGRVTLHDRKLLNKIGGQIAGAAPADNKTQVQGSFKLVLKKRKQMMTYLFDTPGYLVEQGTGRRLVLKDQGRCLDPVLRELNLKNPFGRFLAWDEVNGIFRKFDTARVMDLETGMFFQVQRRAGSKHADVQPLTADDSAVMKVIYGGRWSWQRRAIIVELKGYRIAASMNGMPHGAGAIGGNNFDGHFCIHFRSSKTHSNDENLAHQIMVWKAAGRFGEMMAGAGPDKVVRVAMTAMEQGDYAMAAQLFRPAPPTREGIPLANREDIKRGLKSVKWLAVAEISEPEVNGRARTFKIKASYGLTDGIRVKNRQISVEVGRDNGKIPWKIEAGVIREMLDTKKETDETEPVPDEAMYHDWKVDMKM